MKKYIILLGASASLAGCIVQPSGNGAAQPNTASQAPVYSANQAPVYGANQAPNYGNYSNPSYQANQQPAYNPSDAMVPGTNYHATGNIPCSMGGGQPTGNCPFGVKREGNGSGFVTVTKVDGRTRTIFFNNGQATGYDQSQADRGQFSATKQSDLYIIYIGEERYEIPEAVIFGG